MYRTISQSPPQTAMRLKYRYDMAVITLLELQQVNYTVILPDFLMQSHFSRSVKLAHAGYIAKHRASAAIYRTFNPPK